MKTLKFPDIAVQVEALTYSDWYIYLDETRIGRVALKYCGKVRRYEAYLNEDTPATTFCSYSSLRKAARAIVVAHHSDKKLDYVNKNIRIKDGKLAVRRR